MREDIHKPSSIIPDDYQYVAECFMKVEGLGDALCLKAQREIIDAHRAHTGGTYAQVETTGACQVCGSVNALYLIPVLPSKVKPVHQDGPRLCRQMCMWWRV